MPRSLRRAGAGLTVALTVSTVVITAALAVPAGARAASGPATRATTTASVPAGAGWLATQFTDATNRPHPDGNHFGATLGGTYYPDYGLNADAIFGMAAAGVARDKIATALDYLRRNVDAYGDLSKQQGGPFDGSIAKLALAVLVAGGHPRHFGGYNLLRALHRDQCTHKISGQFGPVCAARGAARNIFSSISESFVMLIEARTGTGPTPDAVSYFESLQCANGGFTAGYAACGRHKADIDATSYAIMALRALGRDHAALHRAIRWLRSKQRPGGYWVTQQIPNVDSTGLAAAALGSTHGSGGRARSWLRSQQVPAGHRGAGAFRYGGTVEATTTGATSPSVLATAQALTGLGSTGSLAVLVEPPTANPAAPLFRPVARTSTRVRRGTTHTITGVGFAAGERVRVTLLDGTPVGRGVAGPLGVVRTRWRAARSLGTGRHVLVLHGVASRLTARHRVVVTRASTSARFTAAAAAAAAAKPTHVGIDIQGKGVQCVAWHHGITGDEILNDVATVTYRSDGLIVQIDGTPASGTADANHYWAYWHDVNGAWHYSSTGANGFRPSPGEVEGWVYDDGRVNPPKPAAKPAGLYASICGSKDAATAPAPTPTHDASPSSTPRPRPAKPQPAVARPTTTAAATRPTSVAATPSRTAAPTTQPARRHAPAPRPRVRHTRSRAATGASTAAVAGTSGMRTAPPTVLAKPTAADRSTGSPVGTYVVIGLVVLLLAGGGVAAMRRRSSP